MLLMNTNIIGFCEKIRKTSFWLKKNVQSGGMRHACVNSVDSNQTKQQCDEGLHFVTKQPKLI